MVTQKSYHDQPEASYSWELFNVKPGWFNNLPLQDCQLIEKHISVPGFNPDVKTQAVMRASSETQYAIMSLDAMKSYQYLSDDRSLVAVRLTQVFDAANHVLAHRGPGHRDTCFTDNYIIAVRKRLAELYPEHWDRFHYRDSNVFLILSRFGKRVAIPEPQDCLNDARFHQCWLAAKQWWDTMGSRLQPVPHHHHHSHGTAPSGAASSGTANGGPSHDDVFNPSVEIGRSPITGRFYCNCGDPECCKEQVCFCIEGQPCFYRDPNDLSDLDDLDTDMHGDGDDDEIIEDAEMYIDVDDDDDDDDEEMYIDDDGATDIEM